MAKKIEEIKNNAEKIIEDKLLYRFIDENGKIVKEIHKDDNGNEIVTEF